MSSYIYIIEKAIFLNEFDFQTMSLVTAYSTHDSIYRSRYPSDHISLTLNISHVRHSCLLSTTLVFRVQTSPDKVSRFLQILFYGIPRPIGVPDIQIHTENRAFEEHDEGKQAGA